MRSLTSVKTISLVTALSLVLLACSGGNSGKTEDNETAKATDTSSAASLSFRPEVLKHPELPALIKADWDGHLKDLYEHLHENPELSFQEFETSKRLAEELRGLGFKVTEKVGQTGLVALMKNGKGPTVMVRADMDALPLEEKTGLPFASKAKGINQAGNEAFIMHACGHDVHMTSWVGTARYLSANKDKWSGTLMMIAQPAEELGKGARAMLEDGLFERFPKPDFNLALHDDASTASGKVGVTSGYAMANVDSVDIHIHGRGGHGAYPHTTVDPIVIGARIVTSLQTLVSRETSPLDSAVITVGSFHGGTKHNIIPDDAKLQITVRSYSDETRDHLLTGIKRVAEAQARSAGVADEHLPTVTIKDEFTPSLYNNPELAERLRTAFKAQLGDEAVLTKTPVMGGEDFSRYGRTDDKIPGVLFWIGAVKQETIDEAAANGTTLPSLHSPLFAPDAERTISTGVETMVTAVLDLMAKEG